jgi:hypothetical protein
MGLLGLLNRPLSEVESVSLNDILTRKVHSRGVHSVTDKASWLSREDGV